MNNINEINCKASDALIRLETYKLENQKLAIEDVEEFLKEIIDLSE